MKYKEGDLPYLIINEGYVLARFQFKVDRENCLSNLEEKFPDCKFLCRDEG